jgi:hypothetical protein
MTIKSLLRLAHVRTAKEPFVHTDDLPADPAHTISLAATIHDLAALETVKLMAGPTAVVPERDE